MGELENYSKLLKECDEAIGKQMAIKAEADSVLSHLYELRTTYNEKVIFHMKKREPEEVPE